MLTESQASTRRSGGGLVIALTAVGAVLAITAAYIMRPHVASVRLFPAEGVFASRADLLEFHAAMTSSVAFDRLLGALPRSMASAVTNSSPVLDVIRREPGLSVSVTARDPAWARAAVNVFANQVAARADEHLRARRAVLDRQLDAAQNRLAELRREFRQFDDALLTAPLNALRQKLIEDLDTKATKIDALRAEDAELENQEAKMLAARRAEDPMVQSLKQQLAQALTLYTDEHPKVKELRASLAALRDGPVADENRVAATAEELGRLRARRAELRQKLERAESDELQSRNALMSFAAREPQFSAWQHEYQTWSVRCEQLIATRVPLAAALPCRRAEAIEVGRAVDFRQLRNFGAGGAAAGLLTGCAFGSLISGVRRARSRTARKRVSLERAAQAPVIGALPDLRRMTESERHCWAIEMLSLLRTAGGASRRSCFVCGVISARRGAGCSTWIDLLADAALRQGNRVMVIGQTLETTGSDAGATESTSMFVADKTDRKGGEERVERYALVSTTPSGALPAQWERAFSAWQSEEKAVVLVELPPATTPEALLLAPALPNLLWISSPSTAGTRATAKCLNALRNVGGHVVAAGLNRCSALAHTPAIIVATMLACFAAQAQVNPAATAARPRANAGPALAEWQRNLTLGPGDVIDISLYGQPDSLRTGVTIGPDGRISYLQATEVPATGLTIDKLRTDLETVLGKFHRAPRVVIVPTAFASKKYFVLGNVTQRGAFSIDRPTTIIEAVARAQGFASPSRAATTTGTAVPVRSMFAPADLSRAFLMRRQPDGKFAREPVDFEALFLRGEMQQNKPLAPDDHLFFPPPGLQEVYVVGQVRLPGVVAYVNDLSVVGALAGRGGFTEKSFRQRVLVVRGSLQEPKAFVVDVANTLRGVAPDFALQPRDIIYVAEKPWAKAEELLELAVSDFLRALVITSTGRNVGPVF